MKQEKRKKRGGEKAKNKSQDCRVTFKPPKTILPSAHTCPVWNHYFAHYFACPVWNPYLVKHIHSIESIQRRATRLICGSHNSYTERLTELNWSTLELRRKYLCLVQLYKIIHGYSDIDYTTYVDLTGPTRTRGNHDCLETCKCLSVIKKKITVN